ncbi:MAG TPA: barstar family protein [Usitatibacteraceae bacterium]|nr:barstar family protein [Usitatibacteraceae bacterium]
MASAELKKLFDSDSPSGVYWLKAHQAVGDLSKLAKVKKFAFFHLEGQKIEKKEQFLNHAAVAMKFPTHFGRNWDAFYDCLTDFEWLEAPGYVIYFDHTDAFASHHESELATVTEIFQDAVDYWKEEGKPMLVLLSGSHPPEGFRAI